MFNLYSEIDNNLKKIILNTNISSCEFVIYPFGQGGLTIKHLLNEKYNIKEKIIIDRDIAQINKNIKTVDYLDSIGEDEKNNYIFLIAADKPNIMKEALFEKGINPINMKVILGETLFSEPAIKKLIQDYEFKSVLDIGCGPGLHTNIFLDAGKKVTGIDVKRNKFNVNEFEFISADFCTYNFNEQFDCLWCSHALEHQLNVQFFLKKLHEPLREGGILAITVPNTPGDIVLGGHITLWNAGLLLYNLVLAGFDCSEASVKTDNINISVILRKHTINVENYGNVAFGYLKELQRYLPRELSYIKYHDGNTPFHGEIDELNW